MEDELDYYHTALLKALRQHRKKFSFEPVDEAQADRSHGRPPGKFRENPLLRNYREFFEVGLLRVLERDDLSDPDIQLLPLTRAQELLTKLHEFFGLLDEIASDEFEPKAQGLTSSQTLFQPNESYPRLERLVSLLEQSDGPFNLTGNTSSSIFRINTLANGKAARSVVQELNQILDTIQLMSHQRPLALASAKNTSNNATAVDNWIQSFDREYRLFAGRILDTISKEFVKCECDPEGHHHLHQTIIQLPDVAVSKTPDSEICFDACLYCPRPKRWQNTRCKLSKYVFLVCYGRSFLWTDITRL